MLDSEADIDRDDIIMKARRLNSAVPTITILVLLIYIFCKIREARTGCFVGAYIYA
jgi:hypothetical protein